MVSFQRVDADAGRFSGVAVAVFGVRWR